jgi:hypothetical protein
VPLPVQALDHATGYLMAAAAVRGMTGRLTRSDGLEARLSLARTAKLLVDAGPAVDSSNLAPETPDDLSPSIEATDWGPARRVKPALTIDGPPMKWDCPARKLGSAEPVWLSPSI